MQAELAEAGLAAGDAAGTFHQDLLEGHRHDHLAVVHPLDLITKGGIVDPAILGTKDAEPSPLPQKPVHTPAQSQVYHLSTLKKGGTPPFQGVATRKENSQ